MTLLTLIPFLGALLVACAPSCRIARAVGLAVMAGVLAFAGTLAITYDRAAGGIQFLERHAWIPSLGIEYFVGADGMSLMLLLLTALISPFALLAAGPGLSKLHVVLILLLETTLLGTFTALNFIHWFVYYELSLVPAFLLIRSPGTKAATAAALRFFIYTLLGGIALLIGFLAIQLATGTWDLIHLAMLGPKVDPLLAAQFGWPPAGLLVFCCIFLGLAVKVPVVPFHTWLPDAYSESPSFVTMLLTGLMSKMGVYGFLRLLVPLFPQRMQELSTPLLWLALATILFSAFAALAQTDLKRLFAYSSINHLGYCLLGIFAVASVPLGAPAARAAATNGVLLQIFNHGLTAATLFCFVGFLERRSGGLRGMADFGGLRAVAPVFTGLMGIAIFSSLGLPGLNGFVGEFLIFGGTLHLVWWAAALAVIGLFVTAVFLLNILQKVFAGPLPGHWSKFPDLTASEILTVVPSIGLMFLLGIFPQLLIALFNKP
ncbi:MAG: NADH-quinone oxidoreductase subunit M [Chthoniobacterales bacterium]|mgnify:CR=1 FL=1|nr:NADH-quinone oxidoreductase subunit M [Chthoniobacterales bacterium]